MSKNILILIGFLAIGFYVYQNFLLKNVENPFDFQPAAISTPAAAESSTATAPIEILKETTQEATKQSDQKTAVNAENAEPVYEPRINDPILIR